MFTLAIDNVVEVPVKFTLKAGKVNKTFSFTLVATRLTQDEIQTKLEDKDKKVRDFMPDVITGWADQKLVMDGDKGAEFSPEALEALLNVAGVANVCFGAYFKECGAKEKN